MIQFDNVGEEEMHDLNEYRRQAARDEGDIWALVFAVAVIALTTGSALGLLYFW